MGTLAKPTPAQTAPRTSSIAEAKANLSSIVRSVENGRNEVTLLRRGVPIAKIVPIAEILPATGYGWMRGGAREVGDIVGPTGEVWDVSDEQP